MLCPQCRQPAQGGAICPACEYPVPERESFGGQGSHYLAVLAAISLVLALLLVLVSSRGIGLVNALRHLMHSSWLWLYALFLLAPLGIGVYYWALLREEELSVTDDSIVRRSYWGEQSLMWADVISFERHPILFSETQLGRIAGLSRVLRDKKLVAKWPTYCYELRSVGGVSEQPPSMRLEPGTIDDLPWLIEIISERVGPPKDV